MKILIVEDDRATAHLITMYLRREGYEVYVCGNGEEGLRHALQEIPDLIVLDVMLPGLDGIEFCRSIREVVNVPVIFLSARTTERDKIKGLKAGADDYVVKPFSPSELVARVHAVLRRVPAVEHPPGYMEVSFDALRIDYRTRTVSVRGAGVHLTPIEYRLLCTLVSDPGRTFSRSVLLDAVSGTTYRGYTRTIDTHIKNLRRKIESKPTSPRLIETVYGVGYRFAIKEKG